MEEVNEARYYRDRKLRSEAEKVLVEAGIPWKCAICGSKDELEIHHINGYESDNRIENLQFLCRPCHLQQHVCPGVITPEQFQTCSICGHRRKYVTLGDRGFVCDRCHEMQLKEKQIPWFKDRKTMICPVCGKTINLHRRFAVSADGKRAFCNHCCYYIELDEEGAPKSWWHVTAVRALEEQPN